VGSTSLQKGRRDPTSSTRQLLSRAAPVFAADALEVAAAGPLPLSPVPLPAPDRAEEAVPIDETLCPSGLAPTLVPVLSWATSPA
jgi:hypothetical protein